MTLRAAPLSPGVPCCWLLAGPVAGLFRVILQQAFDLFPRRWWNATRLFTGCPGPSASGPRSSPRAAPRAPGDHTR
ncbi:hypothetical protein QJS66_22935 [Kocuria rhizophila]|nr:hypothetical protein QJS66_22935 [Kocuria rhizophila]